jgi:hypothetical protein
VSAGEAPEEMRAYTPEPSGQKYATVLPQPWCVCLQTTSRGKGGEPLGLRIELVTVVTRVKALYLKPPEVLALLDALGQHRMPTCVSDTR